MPNPPFARLRAPASINRAIMRSCDASDELKLKPLVGETTVVGNGTFQ
jgi:hypothetical protein